MIKKISHSFLKLLVAISLFIFVSLQKIKNIRGRKRKLILVLLPEKFIEDLRFIEDSNQYLIIKFSERILNFINLYYKEKVESDHIYNSSESIVDKQNILHEILRASFSFLFKFYKIDAVFTSDFRYRYTIDICIVLQKKFSVPWIVLHRENMYANQMIYKSALGRYKKFGKFFGTKIFVHNEVTKKLLTQSGFASMSQIKVLGCIRMDELFKLNKRKYEKKNIILFSFKKRTKVYQDFKDPEINQLVKLYNNTIYPDEIFDTTHTEFIKLAKEYPKIDFIIRTKKMFMKSNFWQKNLKRSFKNVNGSSNLKNLIIDYDTNLYDLLKESYFVIGMDTSAILEASIINLPVIIPYFNCIKNKKYNKILNFYDYFDCFDTPANKMDLIMIMKSRIKDFSSSQRVYKKRKKLFEKYFYKFDCNHLKRYIDAINAEID